MTSIRIILNDHRIKCVKSECIWAVRTGQMCSSQSILESRILTSQYISGRSRSFWCQYLDFIEYVLIYICLLAQSLGRLQVPSTKPSSLSELQKSSFVRISHFWFFSDSVSRPNFYFGSFLKSWPYLPHFTHSTTRSCDSKLYMAQVEWKSLAI